MRRQFLLLGCSLLAVLAGACHESASQGTKTLVFAAASLTGSFQELAKEFEQRNPGSEIELHFAGTPQLVLQVREGAPADVFASADLTNMRRIVETGRTVTTPVTFANNRLTIVTRKGNPEAVHKLSDLARTDLSVVLCGPEVPAGRYAREALAKAGVSVASVSDEPSVKAVVTKVALGEVDAGIVYVTDATSAKDQVDSVTIPDAQNVVAMYPIAVLGSGRNRAGGAAFVAFVTSPFGQAVLERFGFVSP